MRIGQAVTITSGEFAGKHGKVMTDLKALHFWSVDAPVGYDVQTDLGVLFCKPENLQAHPVQCLHFQS